MISLRFFIFTMMRRVKTLQINTKLESLFALRNPRGSTQFGSVQPDWTAVLLKGIIFLTFFGIARQKETNGSYVRLISYTHEGKKYSKTACMHQIWWMLQHSVTEWFLKWKIKTKHYFNLVSLSESKSTEKLEKNDKKFTFIMNRGLKEEKMCEWKGWHLNCS